jgi:Putative beta barrel porin-7 (BBP7)
MSGFGVCRGEAMKGLLSAALLGLGCLASAAGAQEVDWRPCRPEPASALGACVSIGQPRALPPAVDLTISQAIYRPPATSPRVIRLSADLPTDLPADLPTDLPEAVPAAPPPPEAWGTYTLGPPPGTPAGPPGHDATPLTNDLFGADLPRFYARAEYLMWWFKESRLPPLVTTGPNDPNTQPGFLGSPGTVVLFGGSNAGGDLRSGARFTAGAWCDDDCQMGVEVSGFFIGQRSFGFTANSNDFPVLARPFFSLNAMSESVEYSAFPGKSVGTVTVNGPSSLWGAEIDLRCNLCTTCFGRLDFLAGPRYVQLNEGLHIDESLLLLPDAGAFAGSQVAVADHFDTRNQFYGAQVGLNYRMTRGPWSLDLLGKLALGDSHEVVDVVGGQRIVSPTGVVTTANGGLLALSSNSGQFVRDRFAVLPELGVNLGWQVTDWCRLSVGYNFLYWSSVVRPADQIDRVLDETRIPNFETNFGPTGINRPAPLVRATDFWAQGINFGVEFRY